VPIIVDLQGAKMRLGDFESRAVSEGQLLRFEPTASDGALALPHPEAYAALKTGDAVGIDDGRLTGVVESVEASRIEVRLVRGGQLRKRKGFNRAEHPIRLDDLCERDVELAQVAYGAGCRSFAVSFVADGRECEWVRRHVGSVEVIAKVERADALANMAAIARQCDAIWICRGDLGAQLGLTHLGQAIAAIDPGCYDVPFVMAGQVFEHLTEHRDATRSEICHLHDLMGRGYAGLVLSDETAMGHDPLNATRVARALLDAYVAHRVFEKTSASASSQRGVLQR
jgi:pyruvate kinase